MALSAVLEAAPAFVNPSISAYNILVGSK